MNLKNGGNSVGKIMYGGQEFGNRKLEPGTGLYMSKTPEKGGFKDVHLLSTTKNWNNINGININVSYINGVVLGNLDIPSDDLKSLDIERQYELNGVSMSVSRTIVDGEYKLNVDSKGSFYYLIKAI